MRLRLLLSAGLLGMGALAACGSSSNSLPEINFVGNSSCPTDNATPYGSPAPDGKYYPIDVNSYPPVGQAIDEMPHTHVSPPTKITYLHNPPTSGCHYSLNTAAQNWIAPIQPGYYDREIAPEYWVHNLEHGYVIVLYNCPSGCAADVSSLRAWLKGLPADPAGAVGYAKVIVMPYKEMPAKFAAISWDWYDPMNTLSTDELQRFYANHVDRAPEGNSTQ